MKVKHGLTILVLAALFNSAWAQRPKVTNAKIDETATGASLKQIIDSVAQKQSGPEWIGYRIPAKATERTMCCFESWDDQGSSSSNQCCKGCKMDSDHGTSINGAVSNCAPPEPVPYAFVFLRMENKRIERVRVFSADCPLDFAGLPLHWAESVKPEESIDLLTRLALDASGTSAQDDDRSDRDGEWKGGTRTSHNAVMALAMHDVPAADTALEKLIQPDLPLKLRENVAFWLGIERGRKGVEILEKAIKADQNERFRERVTFAFSQSKEPQALKDLIGMAHDDPSPRVRGQAIFWMAQIGGRKQAEQITAAIENDPATEVKKKAVFALSQLHDGEGVLLLIGVAKTNKNPAVRKQAMFWLGQSHDPRALAYLEEVLTK
ncbi:MAG TPA: HEAT repeat domain-containing protein [Candidatus Angelobacter sp.]|nr:HEAT repeat domain-containing protein [Candidatus Angelobacter sp.]